MVKILINVVIPRYAGVVGGNFVDVKPKSWLPACCAAKRRAILRRYKCLAGNALNPDSNQRAPDATSFFPVGGMPTASSLA